MDQKAFYLGQAYMAAILDAWAEVPYLELERYCDLVITEPQTTEEAIATRQRITAACWPTN